VSNPDVEIQKLMRRVDRFAQRLNPGLSAIAIVLSSFLLAEMTIRFPDIYQAEIASSTASLSIDPTMLLTGDVPPSD